MAEASQFTAAKALYTWILENSPTLAKRKRDGLPLTPRLEARAHADGLSYNVEMRFFVEVPCYVPITTLPDQHAEALARLFESDERTRGFATVRPAFPGSSILEFRDFVWNSSL